MSARNDDLTPTGDTDAGVVAELAQLALTPHYEPNTAPFALPPRGTTLLCLESLLATPHRLRGTLQAGDLDSFLRMAATGAPQNTIIVWDVDEGSGTARFEAIYNADTWRDHRAMYVPRNTASWKKWLAHNGKAMDQVTFSAFIEDNAPDVAEPPGAAMLEMARTIEAKKKVAFASAIRLDNGQHQFSYEEQIEGTAQKGKMAIPEAFTIGVAVYVGGPAYRVTARLRYRIQDGGKLTLWYDLLRAQDVIEAAVKEMVATIQATVPAVICRGSIPEVKPL